MPDKKKDFDGLFQNLGIDPKSIQLIILTHGHLDHVGTSAYIQKISGAKVLCHRSYSNDLAKGLIEPAEPQNILGKFLNFMTGFLGSKIEAVIPELVVDDEFDLNEFGISGKVIHTPGHSQSSISIILDNGETLVGDLIREEKSGEFGFGMFFEDKRTALDSLRRIAEFAPRTIYLSHGATIDGNALNKFIESQV
jgi:glyoxylase-like metal-dependent hydrolase (beta-lactamase superfamily II)